MLKHTGVFFSVGVRGMNKAFRTRPYEENTVFVICKSTNLGWILLLGLGIVAIATMRQ